MMYVNLYLQAPRAAAFCNARESQQDDKMDPKRAAITERQNSTLINRLIANGTTTALYFGTLRLESTLKLAQQLAKVQTTSARPKIRAVMIYVYATMKERQLEPSLAADHAIQDACQ